MPIVKICIYCEKVLDLEKDVCVEITKETDSIPQRIAHVGCKQRAASPPPVDDGGGSWMSR